MAQVVTQSGPKQWDLLELRLKNAIDMDDVASPDLNSNKLPLLKIFEPARWEVRPEEVELLKSSIQLASNLVRVGMPYISTFLPSRDEIFKDEDFFDEDGERANLCPSHIPLKENPSKDEVAAAFDELERLAPSIRWQINDEMYAKPNIETGNEPLNWMGVTRLVDAERPWGAASPEEVVAADSVSMRSELKYRPLIIGIMGEYVDAIRNSPKPSEQHLRATFMAGVTMAHEVGHAIFHQDFRSYNPPTMSEPFVGNGCSMELGRSFITWIFGGFHPNEISMEGRVFLEFTGPLSWVPYYTVDEERPYYKTLYSISMSWIQQKLTQSWWDDLPSPQELVGFSSKAKEQLKPITDPHSSETATARTPEWYYSWSCDAPQWRDENNYRRIGYRPGDTVEGLTNEEIEWQKARQPKLKFHLFAGLSEREERRRQKLIRPLRGEEMSPERFEDDDEDFGAIPTHLGPNDVDFAGLDIEDGILERDVSPPLQDDTTPLTRIIVSYRPDEEIPAKRARYDDEDSVDEYDDDDHCRRSTKRVNLGFQNNNHGGRGSAATKTKVDKFLEQCSPFIIASTLSRIEIHNLCLERKLPPPFYTLRPMEGWQRGHPNLDSREDLWAVQRLYNDILSTAEAALFPNKEDRLSKMALKRASLHSVKDWGWLHLLDFCDQNGVDSSGMTDQVRRRVRNFKRHEIKVLRHSEDKQDNKEKSPESETEQGDSLEKAAANPESWLMEELQLFCQQNHLPDTGTKASLIIRARRYLKEQSHGRLTHRHPQRNRVDINGFEVYIFKAILGQSTVGSLKSALFIAGNFPPEAILSLYFADDFMGKSLPDDKPLSEYADKDWQTLRLNAARNLRRGPGSTRHNPIIINASPKVHFNASVSLPGDSIATTVEVPDFPVVTIGDEPTPADILEAMKANPEVQHQIDVVVHNDNPTFSDLLSSVGDRAPRLDQIVQAGGRFGNLKAPRPAISGLAILEEVEGLEDEDAERRRELQVFLDTPPPERSAEERYPTVGSSHMADLFHATNMKYTPPAGGGGDNDDDMEF